MARPQFSPRVAIHGKSLQSGSIDSTAIGAQVVVAADISDGTITQPKLGTDAVGLTGAATVIKRHVTVVKLGQETTGGIKNRHVFRAPPSGARILAAYVGAGTLMYHAAAEADTWIFNLRNQSAGNNLVKNNASLSGVTLAMTGWKTLPINNGNSTLLAGASLVLQLSVSGTAQTLTNCTALIEWRPQNNA